MRFSPQDLEDARQDYMLEMFESTNSVPEKTCPRRVKNIRVQNDLRGKRMGSWVTGTLTTAKIYSLNQMIEDRDVDDLNFPDTFNFDTIDDKKTVQKLLTLCDLTERKLLRSYLEADGSPGHMAVVYDCSPQYINRKVNQLIADLSKRVARPWAIYASMPYK